MFHLHCPKDVLRLSEVLCVCPHDVQVGCHPAHRVLRLGHDHLEPGSENRVGEVDAASDDVRGGGDLEDGGGREYLE